MRLMMSKNLTRRKLFALALAAGGGEALAGSGSDGRPSDEGQKRTFMEKANADIDRQNAEARAELSKVKKERKVAPLFVRLANVVPFLDWDFYYADGEIQWAPPTGSSMPAVLVPKGFVTDLASVPSFLWSKYPPTGRYAYAAVVHDYLYWVQSTSRKVADEIIVLAMRDAGTDSSTVNDFKLALKLAGKKAWTDNQKKRAAGERRILGKFPESKLVSWATWKATPGVFQQGPF